MPDNLQEMVIGFLAGNREVFGSHLGLFLKREFPTWDFKGEFGTLRALVETRLSSVLEHVGKRGGNDIYRNRLFQDGANRSSEEDRELSGLDRDLWALFSNPSRVGSIFVQGEHLIARRAQAHARDGEMELPRIDVNEYIELLPKAWACCAGGVPDDIHSRVDAIIAENPSPWPVVLNFLRKTGHFTTSKLLEEQRVNYIIGQFRLRLQILGLPMETIQKFVEQLAQSRGRRDATKQIDFNADHPRAALLSPSSDQQVAWLRSIAKTVVDNMTVEQILALNLPLGLVASTFLARR